MFKLFGSLAFGAALLQLSALPASATASITHIKGTFTITVHSTTKSACARNATLGYFVIDNNGSFLSGTWTERMTCTATKCTAVIDGWVRIPNPNPANKITAQGNVSASCNFDVQSSGTKVVPDNAPNQTQTLTPVPVSQGGTQSVTFEGDM